MHEQALMRDVMRKVDEVARASGGARVTRIGVRLGALSHFTPDHFREHFADISTGTLAEGADVDAVCATDPCDPYAREVVLESVEVEVPEPAEAR